MLAFTPIVPLIAPAPVAMNILPPDPALVAWMPFPLLVVTFAEVVTEILPRSALKASMPFCAVLPLP